jgi:hypothetical protein
LASPPTKITSPTLAPSKAAPTLAPSKAAPTLAPSKAAPTLAPSKAAPTLAPSKAPISTPSNTVPPTKIIPPPTDKVASLSPEGKDHYTLEEVKKILKLEERDIKIMVSTGELKIERVGKTHGFVKKFVDALIKPSQNPFPIAKNESYISPTVQKSIQSVELPEPVVESTMILPLLDNKNEQKKSTVSKKKQDIPIITSSTQNKAQPASNLEREHYSTPSTQNKAPNLEREHHSAPSTQNKAPNLEREHHSAPSTQNKAPNLERDYYSQNQILQELQIEATELKGLIQQKILSCVEIDGKMYFKKSEVDSIKKGKMIEPTILMAEDQDGKNILEDDEDDPFYFK